MDLYFLGQQTDPTGTGWICWRCRSKLPGSYIVNFEEGESKMRASTKNFGAMLSTLMFVSCGPAQTPSELASQSEAVSAVADRSGERTGEVQESELATTIVPGPVALSVYLPANYDRARSEPYPLLLMLHGVSRSCARSATMDDDACCHPCPRVHGSPKEKGWISGCST